MILLIKGKIQGSKYIDMARVVALYLGKTFVDFFGVIHNVYDDEMMRIDYYERFKEFNTEIELDFRKIQDLRLGLGIRRIWTPLIPYLWVVGNDFDGWVVVEFKDGKWKKYLKQLYWECLGMIRTMAPLVDAVKAGYCKVVENE